MPHPQHSLIYLNFRTGPIIGKCLLTSIEISKLKESYFQKKLKKVVIPVSMYCSNQSVYISVAHKHLGLTLYEKPLFTNYISDKIIEALFKILSSFQRLCRKLGPYDNWIT